MTGGSYYVMLALRAVNRQSIVCWVWSGHGIAQMSYICVPGNVSDLENRKVDGGNVFSVEMCGNKSLNIGMIWGQIDFKMRTQTSG